MKQVLFFLSVVALTGCATDRAIVPSLEGKPRVKINAATPGVAQADPAARPDGKFDFSFSGDIRGAVKALKVVQPKINLLILSGESVTVNVNVNLLGVTLEDALRSIDEQSGNTVDLIWSTSQHQSGYQVLVRYKSPKE